METENTPVRSDTAEAAAAKATLDEMMKAYPPKTLRKRAKQALVNDPDKIPEVGANSRTIPGIITQRGCTYAGCRGVVIGPIYDGRADRR